MAVLVRVEGAAAPADEGQTARATITKPIDVDALDSDDQRAYEEHLARCARCREELASLSEASTALAYPVDAPAPPPALRERIVSQARAERSNVVPPRRRWVFPAAAAVAAAAAGRRSSG